MMGYLKALVVVMVCFALLLVIGAVIDAIEAKMKRKKMYVSGPISGYDPEERIEAFERAAKRAEAMGYKAVNPMESQMDDRTWEEYMRRDIKELCGCDAILMMKGWEKSKGAKAEKYVAETIGMEVFYMIEKGGEE